MTEVISYQTLRARDQRWFQIITAINHGDENG